MIYSRLYESSVEDSVQTPGDDVGVDLDQVEKDIMGDDGIEAHRTEVEDSQEGMIGDPIEEFSMIVYESEFNYNQIMKAIGIAELNETAMGRKVIYEASDTEGFFEHVKRILKNIFKRITEAVKTVLARLDFQVKADKKFIKEREKDIRAGSNSADFSFEGYEFNNSKIASFEANITKSVTESGKSIAAEAIDAVNSYMKMGNEINLVAYITDKYKYFTDNAYFDELCTKRFNIKGSSDQSFVEALLEDLQGKKKTLKSSDIKVEDVISCLKNDRESADIRKAYNAVKKSLAEDLKNINTLKNSLSGDPQLIAVAFNVYQKAGRRIQQDANSIASAYGVYLSVAKRKRAQYRKIAHEFAKAGASKSKDNGTKQESAAMEKDIFSSISFI